MQKLNILNTREVRKIKDKLKEQFGFEGELDYAFLLNEKGRLFIANRDISRVDLEKLRVDKYGLYFGELREELRLSMEGAWLVGKKAKKNVVELSEEEIRKYFLGIDMKKDLGSEKRWVLLKYDGDVISCAKYKEGKILNFLPKIHRSGELMA
jgi:NOL1/NOP2/fmu family ribosome biogenesis protein